MLKRTGAIVLVVMMAIGLSPSTAHAQQTATEANTDEADVMAVIATFFDGLAEQDSSAMISVSEPGARLVLTSSKADGVPVMRSMSILSFVDFIAKREGPPMKETYWDPEVQIHDNLATVWLNYNFYVGEEVDHCGEDAFQLFRSEEGWKIIAIADTQRREGCSAENG